MFRLKLASQFAGALAILVSLSGCHQSSLFNRRALAAAQALVAPAARAESCDLSFGRNICATYTFEGWVYNSYKASNGTNTLLLKFFDYKSGNPLPNVSGTVLADMHKMKMNLSPISFTTGSDGTAEVKVDFTMNSNSGDNWFLAVTVNGKTLPTEDLDIE